MSGELALARFAAWTIRSTLSPELFHRAEVAPGATHEWTRDYHCDVA
jgi:hypothetical protein